MTTSATLTRREILVAALLAPFLKAWRVFVPAPVETPPAIGSVSATIGVDTTAVVGSIERTTMTMGDYQALYVDVLDRMYYSYFESLELIQRPAVETLPALNPACLRHGSSRRSRNR